MILALTCITAQSCIMQSILSTYTDQINMCISFHFCIQPITQQIVYYNSLIATFMLFIRHFIYVTYRAVYLLHYEQYLMVDVLQSYSRVHYAPISLHTYVSGYDICCYRVQQHQYKYCSSTRITDNSHSSLNYLNTCFL